jgi:hypothetical protein
VGTDLGHLLRFKPQLSNSFDKIADIVLFEGQNNPVVKMSLVIPIKCWVKMTVVLVLDAGANDLVRNRRSGKYHSGDRGVRRELAEKFR